MSTFTFRPIRTQLSLTPAERAAIGAPANHNAATQVGVMEKLNGGERCLATYYYSWEQGAITLPEIIAAVRLAGIPIRDAAIAAAVPSTVEGFVGVDFPF